MHTEDQYYQEDNDGEAANMPKIDAFFKLMNDQGASDLHLRTDERPALRIRGSVVRIEYQELGKDELKEMLYEIAAEEKIKAFEETGDVDFGYEIPGLARYRANYFVQASGVSAVFREIPSEILTADQLGLPPVLPKLALLPKGLVLVTGPYGSGKSTTLAAIIDVANRERQGHIMTVEDPIEFKHKSNNCLVSHREVGLHTVSMATGMHAALREDPDIIVVGELRDMETTTLAIEAASTGHLVFSTLHTSSAPETIERMMGQFPTSEQSQIRLSLSAVLRGVVSQALFKRIDKEGRCAAQEILIATPSVRHLIRDGRTDHIPDAIREGKQHGMQLLDDAIMDLLNKSWIDPGEAFMKANDKGPFKSFLKDAPVDFTEA